MRVGLIHAQQLLRAGLRLLLESVPRLEVVWEATNGEAAESAAPVAFVVTEAFLPDGSAQGLVLRLRERRPTLKAVLLVRRPEEVSSTELLEGAAYLPVWASPADLKTALASLKQGRSYLHPDLALALRRPPTRTLTPGERKVLELVSDGLSAEEAAQVLQVSVNTTKTHLRGVYRKLHVRDRTQAVLEALRLGLVCPPDTNRRRQPR